MAYLYDCIIESGHYYQKIWPTKWSEQSVGYAQKLKSEFVEWESIWMLLFIDDVHKDGWYESDLMACMEWRQLYDMMQPDIRIYESEMNSSIENIFTEEVGNALIDTYWSNAPKVKENGYAACAALDAVLTLYKMKNMKDWWQIINVLNKSYSQQQKNLYRLMWVLGECNIFEKDTYKMKTILLDDQWLPIKYVEWRSKNPKTKRIK